MHKCGIFPAMPKVEYNAITPKQAVVLDGDPYIVLTSSISKKDRQKASNAVKMKNLRTGGVIDRTFHQSDVLEEADIEKQEIRYLYNNRGEYWFCEKNNPGNRFSFTENIIAGNPGFLKENCLVTAILFNDEILSIAVPIKVELVVAQAPDAVKGNTSSGATKEAVLETGITIQVPQFINEGDVVSINTETGLYTERIKKA